MKNNKLDITIKLSGTTPLIGIDKDDEILSSTERLMPFGQTEGRSYMVCSVIPLNMSRAAPMSLEGQTVVTGTSDSDTDPDHNANDILPKQFAQRSKPTNRGGVVEPYVIMRRLPKETGLEDSELDNNKKLRLKRSVEHKEKSLKKEFMYNGRECCIDLCAAEEYLSAVTIPTCGVLLQQPGMVGYKQRKKDGLRFVKLIVGDWKCVRPNTLYKLMAVASKHHDRYVETWLNSVINRKGINMRNINSYYGKSSLPRFPSLNVGKHYSYERDVLEGTPQAGLNRVGQDPRCELVEEYFVSKYKNKKIRVKKSILVKYMSILTGVVVDDASLSTTRTAGRKKDGVRYIKSLTSTHDINITDSQFLLIRNVAVAEEDIGVIQWIDKLRADKIADVVSVIAVKEYQKASELISQLGVIDNAESETLFNSCTEYTACWSDNLEYFALVEHILQSGVFHTIYLSSVVRKLNTETVTECMVLGHISKKLITGNQSVTRDSLKNTSEAVA